jgi:hypothetical protein
MVVCNVCSCFLWLIPVSCVSIVIFSILSIIWYMISPTNNWTERISFVCWNQNGHRNIEQRKETYIIEQHKRPYNIKITASIHLITNINWTTLYHIMLQSSLWSRFEFTTSVVIGTDCIGSCKFNYNTNKNEWPDKTWTVRLIELSIMVLFFS